MAILRMNEVLVALGHSYLYLTGSPLYVTGLLAADITGITVLLARRTNVPTTVGQKEHKTSEPRFR
jgi:hypothetical protein